MNVAFVIISCHNLVRTTKDENKCNIRNHFLCKGTIVTKKKRKKMVDVHLFDTDAPVIFWRSVFCNTISTTSFATPLQHHFCNIVFCSIASTPPLQHCLLQQHFNINSVAPSFTTSFLLLSGDKVQGFWWGGGRQLQSQVRSWGLKCLGSRTIFFYGQP